jgi:radical SAM superfamily enzyme
MIVDQMETINGLGLTSIKFHQLQIYRSTPMAEEWSAYPERFLLNDYDAEDYVALVVDIIRRLSAIVTIERFASQAPRQMLLYSPLGGLSLDHLRTMIISTMRSGGYRQGDLATR